MQRSRIRIALVLTAALGAGVVFCEVLYQAYVEPAKLRDEQTQDQRNAVESLKLRLQSRSTTVTQPAIAK